METPKILFLSPKNSARTQIAEGLLKAKAPGKFEVYSAGTEPDDVDPRAKDVLREVGIDISDQTSANIQELFRKPYKFVITICSRGNEKCPVYPLAAWLHWDIPYPQNFEEFRRVRNEISRRLDLFLDGNLIHDGTKRKLGNSTSHA